MNPFFFFLLAPLTYQTRLVILSFIVFILSSPCLQVIREKDLPKPHRVLPPNGVMTMDYRPDRLNIFVDENRRVNNVNNG